MGPNGQTIVDVTFDELYRSEINAIVAIATSLTGDRERGAEVAHEAMLSAFRNWERVSRLDKPGAWVRRVAINRCRDIHRRARRERRALARLPVRRAVDEDPTPDEFWDHVRTLSLRQASVVALHYFDDLSVAEIAEILEIGEGTVKRSLHTARQTLADRLGVER